MFFRENEFFWIFRYIISIDKNPFFMKLSKIGTLIFRENEWLFQCNIQLYMISRYVWIRTDFAKCEKTKNSVSITGKKKKFREIYSLVKSKNVAFTKILSTKKKKKEKKEENLRNFHCTLWNFSANFGNLIFRETTLPKLQHWLISRISQFNFILFFHLSLIFFCDREQRSCMIFKFGQFFCTERSVVHEKMFNRIDVIFVEIETKNLIFVTTNLWKLTLNPSKCTKMP